MKIEKTKAIAMLVALGFPKAGEWPNEKLSDRMGKLPTKFGADEIPDEFDELFDELSASDPETPIELILEGAKAKKKSKSKPKPAEADLFEDAKAEVVAEPTNIVELPVAAVNDVPNTAPAKKKAATKKATPEATPAEFKKRKVKVAKADKPAKSKKTKRDSNEPTGLPRADSIKGQVLATISADWIDEETLVAKLPEIPFEQLRRPLYHLSRAGKIERRSSGYQYRITPEK